MLVKAIFFTTVITLFLGVVFLDQNNNLVPLKIVIGSPYQVGLSSIIVVSMITGALLAVAAMLLYKTIRKKDADQ